MSRGTLIAVFIEAKRLHWAAWVSVACWLGACGSNESNGASNGSGATGGASTGGASSGGQGGGAGSGASAGSGGVAGSGGCMCTAAQTLNCGHRGAGKKGDLPENTIESVQAAFEQGADMVEVDVLHSADGVVVLMHDDTVDRTTDGTGCVGELTVAELQQLDAAEGTTLEGQGVTVPTLEELMLAVDGAINIEIKATSGECPGPDRPKLAADIAAAIAADTKPRQLVVSSFDADLLSELRSVDSTIEIGFLGLVSSALDIAEERGFQALNVLHSSASADLVTDAHSRGMSLNVWTANGDDLAPMLDIGVDMIITDEPDALSALIESRCAAECPP